MEIPDSNSIYEYLIFSTVRIESVLKDGKTSTGTGFIVSYRYKDSEDKENYDMFLVTNKHVIQDATLGKLIFNTRNGEKPDFGNSKLITIPNFESIFFGHPNPDIDIAITPFLPILTDFIKNNIQIYYTTIPLRLIPSETISNEIDAVEDVIIIGYPNGIFDKKNCLPIIRKGITATHPNIDFDGKPIFIVDASIFPGSSGSPVFICKTGSYTKKGINDIFIGNRLMFLGIIAETYVRKDTNKLEIITIPAKDIPIVRTSQMIDLGIVYKSRCIVEVIEDYLHERKLLPPSSPKG